MVKAREFAKSDAANGEKTLVQISRTVKTKTFNNSPWRIWDAKRREGWNINVRPNYTLKREIITL